MADPSARGLATWRQLWVLNRAGWLAVREQPWPEGRITYEAADAAIKRGVAQSAGDRAARKR